MPVTDDFTSSELDLNGLVQIFAPTALVWGPDGRLYVTQQFGEVFVLDVTFGDKNPGDDDNTNSFYVTAAQTIEDVKDIPNHNDDGADDNSDNRQVTGIDVTQQFDANGEPVVIDGKPAVVMYVTSSDSRIGAGNNGADTGLDTNSGVITRLTQTEDGWDVVDIVRGLPRSEENHAVNGLEVVQELDANGNLVSERMIVAVGGNANSGAPSNNFAGQQEQPLSGAILEIDLDEIRAIEDAGIKFDDGRAYVYDIPTLDDPTRDAEEEGQDPFGGNDGLNSAKLLDDGPIQIYSAGYRNPYDVEVTDDGRVFTYDNGGNNNWGGRPAGEDQNGDNLTIDEGVGTPDGYIATNLFVEDNNEVGGNFNPQNWDHLHEVTRSDDLDGRTLSSGLGGATTYQFDHPDFNETLTLVYGGHPNPTRAEGARAGLLYTPDGGVTNSLLMVSNVEKTGGSSDYLEVVDWLLSVGYDENFINETIVAVDPGVRYSETFANGFGTDGRPTETGVFSLVEDEDGPVALPADIDSIVETVVPVEGDYLEGGFNDGSIDTGKGSINGLTEYTSTIFDDAGIASMQGALIAASLNQAQLYVIGRDANGVVQTTTSTSGNSSEASDIDRTVAADKDFIQSGGAPLGLASLGDDLSELGNQVAFRGTLWATIFKQNGPVIEIYQPGNPDDNPLLGLANYAGQEGVDLTDNDGDGVDFYNDPFEFDSDNGIEIGAGDSLSLNFSQVDLTDNPDFSGTIGDTGLMGAALNGGTSEADGGVPNRDAISAADGFPEEDQEDGLFDNGGNLIPGGNAPIFQIKAVGDGTAIGSANTLRDAVHTGVFLEDNVESVTAEVDIANWWVLQPGGERVSGMSFGDGTQENFVRFAFGDFGDGELSLQVGIEIDDVFTVLGTVTDPAFTDALTIGSNLPDLRVTLQLEISEIGDTYELAANYKVAGITEFQSITLSETSLPEGVLRDVLDGSHTISDGDTTLPSGAAFGFMAERGDNVDFLSVDYDELRITAEGDEIDTDMVVYRVNAGGQTVAAIDGGIDWESDATYFDGTGPVTITGTDGLALSNALTQSEEDVDYTPGVDQSVAPWELFVDERFDNNANGANLSYNFDVEAGKTYEITVYYTENWNNIFTAEERIFDIEVEGVVPTIFDDINPIRETVDFVLGADAEIPTFEDGFQAEKDPFIGTALQREYTYLATDDLLTLTWLYDDAGGQNPKVNAIEITEIANPDPIEDTIAPIVVDIDVETSLVDQDSPRVVTLTVTDETAFLPADFAGLDGSELSFNGVTPAAISAPVLNLSTDLKTAVLTYTIDPPADTGAWPDGSFSVTLAADSIFDVAGNAAAATTVDFAFNSTFQPGDVVLAVNAGGAAVDGEAYGLPGVTFQEDTSDNPHASVDFSQNTAGPSSKQGNLTFKISAGETFTGVDLPDEIFETERWGNDFSYNVDLPDGTYLVDLYLAELFVGVANDSGVGARSFDASLEGTAALDDFDLFDAGDNIAGNDAGAALVKTVRTFETTVNDGVLNIRFDSIDDGGEVVADNAKINAFAVRVPPADGGPISAALTGVGSIEEDAGTALYTIEISEAPSVDTEITVTLTPSAANAAFIPGDAQFTAGGTEVTLTFTPGGPLTQTVTVDLLDDTVPELAESYDVTISGVDITAGAASTVTTVIGANDGAVDSVNGVAATGGDFSNEGAAPTDLGTLAEGETTVVASQQGDSAPGGRERDYFTFTVAEGQVLTGIILDDWQSGEVGLPQAFIAIQEGSALTVDPTTYQNVGDLLGGYVYNEGDIANAATFSDGNLLSADKLGAGSAQGIPFGDGSGFDGPLPAGTYTIWLNQGGSISTASLRLVTEVPAEDALVQIADAPTINEDGDTGFVTLAFPVTVVPAKAGTVDVAFTVNGVADTATVTFDDAGLATLNVAVANDDVVPASEITEVTLTGTTTDGFAIDATAATASGQVIDDDAVVPDTLIQIADAPTINEDGDTGSVTLTFPVSTVPATAGTVSVAFTVNGVANTTSLTFDSAGLATLSIAVANDDVVPESEITDVTLTGTTTEGFAIDATAATASGQVINDDEAVPDTLVQISDAATVVEEGDSGTKTLAFVVTTVPATAGPLDVAYTVNGMATDATLAFNDAGQATLTVTVENDNVVPASDKTEVTLTNVAADGFAIDAGNATASGRVIDDDALNGDIIVDEDIPVGTADDPYTLSDGVDLLDTTASTQDTVLEGNASRNVFKVGTGADDIDLQEDGGSDVVSGTAAAIDGTVLSNFADDDKVVITDGDAAIIVGDATIGDTLLIDLDGDTSDVSDQISITFADGVPEGISLVDGTLSVPKFAEDGVQIQAEAFSGLADALNFDTTTSANASGGETIRVGKRESGSISHDMSQFAGGLHRIAVTFVDEADGVSSGRVLVDDVEIGTWSYDGTAGSQVSPLADIGRENEAGNYRTVIFDTAFEVNDTSVLTLEVDTSGGETAQIDYVTVLPSQVASSFGSPSAPSASPQGSTAASGFLSASGTAAVATAFASATAAGHDLSDAIHVTADAFTGINEAEGFFVAEDANADNGAVLQLDKRNDGSIDHDLSSYDAGTYKVAVTFIDEADGISTGRVFVDGVEVGTWDFDGTAGAQVNPGEEIGRGNELGNYRIIELDASFEITSTSVLTLEVETSGGETGQIAGIALIQEDAEPTEPTEPTEPSAPTGVSIASPTLALAEGVDTTDPVLIGDIAIEGGAQSALEITLIGDDADKFEIIDNALYLKAGTVLDAETQDSLDVTVVVTDTSEGSTAAPVQAPFTLSIADVNDAPSLSVTQIADALPEDTNTAAAVRVADITVSDDAIGRNDLTLTGADADKFAIVGDGLFIKAGTLLDFEVADNLDVTVELDDVTLGDGIEGSEDVSIAITDVNKAPTLDVTITAGALSEDTDTSSAVQVATFTVDDDATGTATPTVTLTGDDADLFEIVDGGVFLKAGTALDFDANATLDVSIVVDDPTIGNGPENEVNLSIALTDENRAPTLDVTVTADALSEDTDTTSAVEVATFAISDDATGSTAPTVTLTGDDADLFEVVGEAVFLKAGTALDFDSNPTLDVTISVDDPTIGAGPEAEVALSIDLTDENRAPTVDVTVTADELSENTDTSSAVEVATVTVTDDETGAADITLTGDDADLFEVVGEAVFLKAGTVLDFETNDTLDLTIVVDDPAIGDGAEDQASLSIAIEDANDAPVMTVTPVLTQLSEDTDTSNAITVATVSVSDDALGSFDLGLSGDDASLFAIVADGDGFAVNLKAGATLDAGSLDVSVTIDDENINGSAIEDSVSLSLSVSNGDVDTDDGVPADVLEILGLDDENFDGTVQGVAVDSSNEGGDNGAVVLSVNNARTAIDDSNFRAGSFKLTNTGDKEVAAVFIDVRSAIFPDHVFDIDGTGGDTAAKPFRIDTIGEDDDATGAYFVGRGGVSGNTADNLFFAGDTPVADQSGLQASDSISGGYRGLLVRFDGTDGGFGEGEVVGFSGDGDPNSIAGYTADLLKPNNVTDGEFDTGGQSGLELIGSSFTVLFADGTTATGYLGSDTSNAGAVGEAVQGRVDSMVTLTVDTGIGTYDSGQAGEYAADVPQITVAGSPGDVVRVTLVKGFQDTNEEAGEGVAETIAARLQDSSPDFLANNAFDVQYYDVTIKSDGTVTLPADAFDYVNTTSGVSFDGDDVQPLALTASVIDFATDRNALASNGDADFVPVGPLSDPIYLSNPSKTPVDLSGNGPSQPDDGYFEISGTGDNQYFKIQIEDGTGGTNPNGKWEFFDTADENGYQSDFQGEGYYVFGDPGLLDIDNRLEEIELLEYTIYVPEEAVGEYSFSFITSRDGGFATDGTEIANDQQNDLWLNFKPADVDGFGEIVPLLSGLGDNHAEPVQTDFVKVFGGGRDGNWAQATRIDSDPDNVAAKILIAEEGLYTVQVEGRSTGYHIDYFELFKGNNPGSNSADSAFVATDTSTFGIEEGPAQAPAPTVLATVIKASSDDVAVEGATGDDILSFGDLDDEAGTVGLRFDDITVPDSATIVEAYLSFEAAISNDEATDLTISLEDSADAATYSVADGPTDRVYLADEFVWNDVPAWEDGETYQSPDLAGLLNDWIASNGSLDDVALGFQIEGTGARAANAFDGLGDAPELFIVFNESDALL